MWCYRHYTPYETAPQVHFPKAPRPGLLSALPRPGLQRCGHPPTVRRITLCYGVATPHSQDAHLVHLRRLDSVHCAAAALPRPFLVWARPTRGRHSCLHSMPGAETRFHLHDASIDASMLARLGLIALFVSRRSRYDGFGLSASSALPNDLTHSSVT